MRAEDGNSHPLSTASLPHPNEGPGGVHRRQGAWRFVSGPFRFQMQAEVRDLSKGRRGSEKRRGGRASEPSPRASRGASPARDCPARIGEPQAASLV